MRNRHLLWLFILGLVVPGGLYAQNQSVQDQVPPPPPPPHDPWFTALCGLWQSTLDQQRVLNEHWWFDGEVLRGQGWLTKSGHDQAKERLRLENLSGESRYWASPAGQATTVFTAAADADPNARRWINPQHDFPQVIRYRLMAGELEAHITNLDDEGLQAGRRWRFQRLRPCQANTEEH